MKGPKWLQKVNEEELLRFALMDPHPEILETGEHYLAGPGTGLIYEEEEWHLPNGNRLGVSSSVTHSGAKPSWVRHEEAKVVEKHNELCEKCGSPLCGKCGRCIDEEHPKKFSTFYPEGYVVEFGASCPFPKKKSRQRQGDEL
jgi:hypothetical protein